MTSQLLVFNTLIASVFFFLIYEDRRCEDDQYRSRQVAYVIPVAENTYQIVLKILVSLINPYMYYKEKLNMRKECVLLNGCKCNRRDFHNLFIIVVKARGFT